jgi:hypothetical protein
MNIEGLFEAMIQEKQQRDRCDDGKAVFEKILAKVPDFKQAMFTFEAKDGIFGPVTYREQSLRQNAAEEEGYWLLHEAKNTYEFRTDYEWARETGYEDTVSDAVGSAVEEILNNNNELLVRALFGDSKAAFSNGNALTNGTLEVSIVPQESSVDLGEDDTGRSCYLSEGFRGFSVSFRSTVQVSNAVMVP